MAKPSITGPTIVVDADGEILVWTDGHASGSRALLNKAKFAAKIAMSVDLSIVGPSIVAELDNASNPAGALAALMASAPERCRILQAPQDILDLIELDKETEEDIAWFEYQNELVTDKERGRFL